MLNDRVSFLGYFTRGLIVVARSPVSESEEAQGNVLVQFVPEIESELQTGLDEDVLGSDNALSVILSFCRSALNGFCRVLDLSLRFRLKCQNWTSAYLI
jgi:hypothetical protein